VIAIITAIAPCSSAERSRVMIWVRHRGTIRPPFRSRTPTAPRC
jgi:hypothetical protein